MVDFRESFRQLGNYPLYVEQTRINHTIDVVDEVLIVQKTDH